VQRAQEMKTLVVQVVGAVLVLLLYSGCGAPHARIREPAEATVHVVINSSAGAVPNLATNDVMSLALAALANKRINTQGYVCSGIVFEGASTNPAVSKKWILCFSRQPRSPDMEFFVVVDDNTRDVQVHR